VLLSLQERRASNAAASTSDAAAGMVVPRTHARLARSAPGWRSEAARPPSAAGPASEQQRLSAAGPLASLLAKHKLPRQLPASAPWAEALQAQVETAAAEGSRGADLAAWLEARAAPAGRVHWLALAAAADAGGGLQVLPLGLLERLAHALAASSPLDLLQLLQPEAADSLPLWRRQQRLTAAARLETGAFAAAVDSAKAAYLAALSEQLLERLESPQEQAAPGGAGPAPDVARAAALLESLSRAGARPPQPLLQALLAPLRGALVGAAPEQLGALVCGAAECGALLRASWLSAFRATAAGGAVAAAGGGAAADLLWGLARCGE
jgi:hypothetical protein